MKNFEKWNFLLRVASIVGALTGVPLSLESMASAAGRPAGGDVDISIAHSRVGFVKNIGNESIYQIVVDRFANGESSNDCFDERRFCGNSGNKSDWYAYQGGDLRGVIDHLDYIQSLGATRIWLTPVFENQQVTAIEPRFGGWAELTSYHGYWIRDWFRLNPFFTDRGAEDYAIVGELIAEAKARGIKIYFDSVANHSSPINPTAWSVERLNRVEPLATSAGQSHRGAVFKQGRYYRSYGQEDRLVRSSHTQARPRGKDLFFHHYGNIGDVNGGADWGNPFIVENYNLSGLADLNQNNQDTTNYIIDSHQFWLERFPDLGGYRMDTVKHVNNGFWRYFSEQVFARFPNAEIFGEYFDGGAAVPLARDFYNSTKMSMLDFPFRSALVNIFVNDQGFENVTNVWQADHLLDDASGMVTYLDSHDHARLRGTGLSFERMRLAIVLWLASRGVPCVYYGMEQDLFTPNDPGDPYNRPMMRSFAQDSQAYSLVQRLLQLRKNNSALRYGETHVVHQTRNIFGFERLFGTNQVFVALSKNRREGADEFTMKGLKLADGEYHDVLSGKNYRVSGGRVDLRLNYGEVVVLSSGNRGARL